MVLGAGEALEVDGGGARGHGEVGRRRAVRRRVVEPVVRAVRLGAGARRRDLDHQVRGRRASHALLPQGTVLTTHTAEVDLDLRVSNCMHYASYDVVE